MACLGFEPGHRMVGAHETTEIWRFYGRFLLEDKSRLLLAKVVAVAFINLQSELRPISKFTRLYELILAFISFY